MYVSTLDTHSLRHTPPVARNTAWSVLNKMDWPHFVLKKYVLSWSNWDLVRYNCTVDSIEKFENIWKWCLMFFWGACTLFRAYYNWDLLVGTMCQHYFPDGGYYVWLSPHLNLELYCILKSSCRHYLNIKDLSCSVWIYSSIGVKESRIKWGTTTAN